MSDSDILITTDIIKAEDGSTDIQPVNKDSLKKIDLLSSLKKCDSVEGTQNLFMEQWNSRRSWRTEFFCTDKLTVPVNLHFVKDRLVHNIVYFQTNYFLLVFFMMLYTIITTPFLLLFCVIMGAMSYYLLSTPVIANQIISTKTKLIFITLTGLAGIIFTSASTTLFSIVVFALSTIFLHAVFWTPQFEHNFTTLPE